MDSKKTSSLWNELLPGIPDDIALDEIAVKLPANDVATLSSISQRWRQEITERVVYDARVRYRSTEGHVAFQMWANGFNELLLYSLRNKTLHRLPRVPKFCSGYQFITLDGKIYVLGGRDCTREDLQTQSRRMYMLDLVGQKRWKQCASMVRPRQEFGLGAVGGKIYVFGGNSVNSGPDPNCAAEVYDSKVDAWYPIKPMLSKDVSEKVTSVGEELFVHSRFAYTFEIYNTLTNEWRVGEPIMQRLIDFDGLRDRLKNVFTIQGKLYGWNSEGISVYNTEKKLWTHCCRIACDELGPVNSVLMTPIVVLPVNNNELLANMMYMSKNSRGDKLCLLESSGFGSNNKDVVWLKSPCTIDSYFNSMYLVQL
ncbi:unnamed protein product [Calypogeia fissa]